MSVLDCFFTESDQTIPLLPVTPEQLQAWLKSQPESVSQWIKQHQFEAKPKTFCVLPNAQQGIDQVLYGVEGKPDIWSLSAMATQLPKGDYQLHSDWDEQTVYQVLLGWGLGNYRYDRYQERKEKSVRLQAGNRLSQLEVELGAIYRVRDLINTPANDLMPAELASETQHLAEHYGAKFSQIVGDHLLSENYPAIHAVGRASQHVPRLLEIQWGNPEHPRVALVGKGVCFDSGGLDIKPSSGMRYMQKDMGGAAHALGLAELIMQHELPVYLHVLIPAVENAISGNAFHPGDVLESRKGLTIEIENTDAEGRLILADALTEVCQYHPDLVIDFATLTGAARVAVGTEIACFFTNVDLIADELSVTAEQTSDPVWRLPLHAPYSDHIKSRVADILNCSTGGFGGAITAALFLQRFVQPCVDWVHFDIMAWNQRNRPGRPEGGEAMGLRCVFEMLKRRYQKPL